MTGDASYLGKRKIDTRHLPNPNPSWPNLREDARARAAVPLSITHQRRCRAGTVQYTRLDLILRRYLCLILRATHPNLSGLVIQSDRYANPSTSRWSSTEGTQQVSRNPAGRERFPMAPIPAVTVLRLLSERIPTTLRPCRLQSQRLTHSDPLQFR